MGSSKEWENIYKVGQQNSKWPWSDVVTLTHRYIKDRVGKNVLELGTGAGANIPFFMSIGMKYYGLEWSEIATERLRNEFADDNTVISCGDFSKEIPFDETFDLIFDRGAMVCNDDNGIKMSLRNVYEKLTRGGVLFRHNLVYRSSQCF